MGKVTVTEIAMTEEDAKRLEALMESGSDEEVRLEVERITGHKLPPRRELPPLDAMVRTAHELMHAKEQELLEAFLCISVAMMDGDPVPRAVIESLKAKLIDFHTRWEKAGCAGSA